MATSIRPAPVCGILSLAMTPLVLVFVAVSIYLFEVTMGGAPRPVWQFLVVGGRALILGGLLLGVIALVRHERQRWLALAGWGSTAALVYWLFYLD